MSDKIILKVEELKKEYKSLKAVDGVSFSIKAGQIVGLLGPNGAGKTTTINMILRILEPTSGTIEVGGKNFLTEECSDVIKKMNFAAVYAQLPSNLTIFQNLYVFGLLYEVPNLRKKIKELMQEFDLEQFANVKAGVLSSGEMSRLNLAKAVINEPMLLLLDEPTASLDPSISHLVREKIKDYAARTGAAVLWTSHDMQEITDVCDQVLFLSHGKILLSGDPKTLPTAYGKKDLEELFISVARQPLEFEQ